MAPCILLITKITIWLITMESLCHLNYPASPSQMHYSNTCTSCLHDMILVTCFFTTNAPEASCTCKHSKLAECQSRAPWGRTLRLETRGSVDSAGSPLVLLLGLSRMCACLLSLLMPYTSKLTLPAFLSLKMPKPRMIAKC